MTYFIFTCITVSIFFVSSKLPCCMYKICTNKYIFLIDSIFCINPANILIK